MVREIEMTGRTVDEAVTLACESLGVERDDVEIEIIDLPKKGFFGLKNTPAKVKVTHKASKSQLAVDYVTEVLGHMGLTNVKIDVKEEEESATLVLEGEGLGLIIGRRGETLDALQYLAGLVANRGEGSYFRITLDSGNYREKREKTLEQLALKIANTAVKTGRSTTLEPMNPYERRIIHSAVQQVEGATSSSIGEEPNRRVVISSKNPRPPRYNNNRDRGPRTDRGGDRGGRGGYNKRPYNKEGRPPRRDNRDGRPPRENRTVTPDPNKVRANPPKEAEGAPLFGKITLDD
ncbi:RNA-binding cell elongation regulator Jag/EloR [Zongyangia hominis]|uniref:RNA-binding cell elongation regulator Jag/EloR n=1 Tax=Zongyangia hominis TaxID=2763677 RepID=UPI0021CCDFB3|nr:RNA-binding cell elongation regulator Jag/EloR [Zongyangia hominis]